MKAKRETRFFAASLAVSLLAGATGSSFAASAAWDNGGGDYLWNTAANWNPDGVPDMTTDVAITSNTSAANPANITGTAASANSIVAPATGTMYLAIGADLSVGGTFGVAGKSGKGFVTQTAGAVTAANLSLVNSTNTGGTGSYTLTGGSVHVTGQLNATGGKASVFTQNGSGTIAEFGSVYGGTSGVTTDRWTYNLMDGTLTIDGSVDREYGAWFFNQTGGTASIGTVLNLGTGYRSIEGSAPMEWRINGNSSLSVAGNVTLGYLYDGTTGHNGSGVEGQFTLDGSKGTGSDVTVGGSWHQAGALSPNTTTDSWGRLEGIIDTTAINTPSAMRKIVVTGNVTFDNESYLLPEFDPSATPTAGTWTLMTWNGTLTNNGLTLDPSVDSSAGDGIGWSFNLDSVGKTLTVTYSTGAPVPEPASLALLGLGGLMMIKRRLKA